MLTRVDWINRRVHANLGLADMILTENHLRFLQHHEIRPELVMDARAMRTGEWKAELKRRGMAVALVASSCRREHGLNLRLSSGHCMQCSPQGIASWKRHHKPAYLYVSRSAALGLLKIGISQSSDDRTDGSNRDGYGGATDWTVLYRRRFERAGWVEAQVHSALQAARKPRPYTRLGHGTVVTATELFDCDYEIARAAIEPFADFALEEGLERKRSY